MAAPLLSASSARSRPSAADEVGMRLGNSARFYLS